MFDALSVSLPRRLDAMPCNEDHDVPHKPPTNVEGAACGPATPGPPFDLLLHRGFSNSLLDNAEREGCLLGIGEGALEDRNCSPSS